MKRNFNSLYRLIKSMNKSEKRYFKLYSSAFKESTQLSGLYKLIINDVSEKKLRSEFRTVCKGKDFYGTKKKLYEQLLKSLRNFHTDASAEERVISYINNARLLLRKRLANECAAELEKAVLLAKQSELFLLLLQAYDVETKMNIGKPVSSKEANRKEADRRNAILKYDNYCKYSSLESAFAAMYYKHSFVRNKRTELIYSKIINDPFIKDENNALSVRAEIIRHNILCSYYFSKYDFQSSYFQANKIVNKIESNPGFALLFQPKYVAALSNAIKCLLYLRQYDKMRGIINKLKNIKPTANDTAIRQFELKTLEVSVLLDIGEFKAALSMIPQTEKELNLFFEKVGMKSRVILLYQAALANFGLERYSESVKCLNKFMYFSGSEKYADIYYFARLLNLILHYEKMNIDHVQYKLKNLNKYFYTPSGSYKFEGLILELIKEILAVNGRNKLIKLLITYKLKLENVLKNPFEKVAIEYFDIVSWIDSKIQNRPFAEIVKEKAKIYPK